MKRLTQLTLLIAVSAGFLGTGCIEEETPGDVNLQQTSNSDEQGVHEFETSAQAAVTSKNFGTDCQESYENGWQNTLSYVNETCNYFNAAMDDFAHKEYYYNLHGAKTRWETSGDQHRLERVDLAFSNTHGGAWTNDAVWAMWDDGDLARSSNMWLGNESKGLSIWATYSCETLAEDGRLWTRWDSVMAGGLRIVAGSHDTVWSSSTTDEIGEDFAENLESGSSVRNSWRSALEDWYHDQDAAVLSTGTNSSDCNSRLVNIDWDNFDNYPRRTGTNPGWWCEDHWSNM